MKTCNKCGVEKPYTEFFKDKSRSDGFQTKCKQCDKISIKAYFEKNPDYNKQRGQNNKKYFQEKAKQRHQSKKLSYWIVYMLPNCIPSPYTKPYVGKTNNPSYRMTHHKYKGRDTTGWIELHRFDTDAEALAKEAEYHALGYAGKCEKIGPCRNTGRSKHK